MNEEHPVPMEAAGMGAALVMDKRPAGAYSERDEEGPTSSTTRSMAFFPRIIGGSELDDILSELAKAGIESSRGAEDRARLHST